MQEDRFRYHGIGLFKTKPNAVAIQLQRILPQINLPVRPRHPYFKASRYLAKLRKEERSYDR